MAEVKTGVEGWKDGKMKGVERWIANAAESEFGLVALGVAIYRLLRVVKLLLDNLPPTLASQRDALAQCLVAMNRAAPLRSVYLFGSHARGEARPDSDVDLCLVADGAERQQETLVKLGSAIWDVWPRPPFTLIPITPQRLAEKKAAGDHFYQTVLNEGVLLAEED